MRVLGLAQSVERGARAREVPGSRKPDHLSDGLTFSDFRSVGDCHDECATGCTEPRSSSACFTCKHLTQTLRNRAGFKCVTRCDDGYYLDGDNCRICSVHCKTCSASEVCETCPGAQLIIDVAHYGHFDHGTCVDQCPMGLIADYQTNLIQARCVLKENMCGEGFYLAVQNKCTLCDEACKTCHGAGPLFCDTCAEGYGNVSVGYCRPCCKTGQQPEVYHCEDCTLKRPLYRSHASSSLFWSFIWVILIVMIMALIGFGFMWCFKEDGIEYTKLSHYNSAQDRVRILDSESDSDGEEIFNSRLRTEI
ncbi:unnamed protein product, partial [Mesorhabditis belari]|uniref:Uncharacterized protein n=1 Tax=Mesorhabditis belari TaxID=2138241 RepID=A0AAF3J785_9BILA